MSKPKLSLRKRLALHVYANIKKDLAATHELRSLFWECTLRCNLHCRHCGSDCKATAGIPDMPKADFLKVIDSITPHVDTHKLMVIFSGGEPLMRRDIEEIGLELYKREYPWGMVTNGMLLDAKRMDSLLKAGLRSITVSLDGFEAQHNYIRRHPASYNNALRAIRLITKAPGIVYDVVTCVNPNNYDILPQLKEFLIEEGVKQWRCFSIFPAGRGGQDTGLQLSREQYKGLMDFIRATRQEGRIKLSYGCEGFLGAYEAEVRDHFFGCMAGIAIGGIRINGAITACTSIRANFDQGNIYEDDFWEVWQNRFQKYRDREWAHKGICAHCKAWKWCLGNGMHLYDKREELMLCHYHDLL